ncbi:MAG: hypothetical protein M3340_02925 [Actinomycetota bacterium]|nr:hypothetical protein [Actinomycetota bacterium]
MRTRLLATLVVALLAGLPTDAGAQGAVAFSSLRCDQDGRESTGSRPPDMPPFCTRGLFVVGDDGTGLKRLTDGASPGQEPRSGDFSPSWSPDGERIVFERQTSDDNANRLFTMRANGSDQRRLIASPPPDLPRERQPAWSPRGDLIVFAAPDFEAGCFSQELRGVRPDGSGLHTIGPPGHHAYSPTFTPDGSKIVYYGGPLQCTGGRFPTPTGTDYAVWLADPDGTNPARLTAGDIQPAANGFSFSPDGERIAVTLPDGGLYTVRTDGSELTRLTDYMSVDPDWSGTGEAIFFQAGTNAFDTTINRLSLAVSAPSIAITAPGLGDGEPDWSLLGRVTSALPVVDDLPPVVLLGDRLGVPAGRSTRKAQSGVPGRSRIPFLVVDRTGIRRVEAAVGLRVKGRCRFAGPKGLGRRRSCSAPVYVRVKSAAAWRSLTKRLPAGKYQVRFRTTDVRGNTARRPKPRTVRLK